MTVHHFTAGDIGKVVAVLRPAPSTPEDLARYAKASGDSNPLHLDLAFARKAGFDNLVVHGMLGMAHMGRLLTTHFPAESISTFSARFTAVSLVGEQMCYEATLTECDADGCRLDLVATTAAGVVSIRGEATIKTRDATK